MAMRLWQLYDEHGHPDTSRGGVKYEAMVHGLLHGSAHVWLWRHGEHGAEVLFQKRAADKINWPGMYDKSAGGHIGFGEHPLDAAVRRATEEIGVTISPGMLRLAGVHYWYMPLEGTELIENEYQWIYLANIADPQLTLNSEEVDDTLWMPLTSLQPSKPDTGRGMQFVPYGQAYYAILRAAIEHVANNTPVHAQSH